jgi:hypothetical protein
MHVQCKRGMQSVEHPDGRLDNFGPMPSPGTNVTGITSFTANCIMVPLLAMIG